MQARHPGLAQEALQATTDSKRSLPVAPNLLARNFTPEAPNQLWTGDNICIWTGEDWLYVAIVLVKFNREIDGWSIKQRMNSDIATEALTMAWFRRKPGTAARFHSDRGSQCVSRAMAAKLAEYGMTVSRSRKRNC